MGRWKCDRDGCKRSVEYDGAHDALFNLRRRNKHRQWVIFTRALLDMLFSFIITARTTYTAATRHLSANVQCFSFRRQDVVKIGTAMLRSFVIPPETSVCSICGPNPEFIIIDGQALGCTDPDDVCPARDEEECPVLDIPATKLCVVEDAGLRAAIIKVIRSSTPLTNAQVVLLRKWHVRMLTREQATVEGGAAYLFFKFFPLGDELPPAQSPRPSGGSAARGQSRPQSTHTAAGTVPDSSISRKRSAAGASRTLESALRLDADGAVTLGGKGPPATKAAETWRDRTGLCAPNFRAYPRDDDGAWLSIVPFLQAFLAETVSGMFHGHDERAIRLVAHTLRLKGAGAWRELTKPLEGVGFVASFMGRFASTIDADPLFRMALGHVLLQAVSVETIIDDVFSKAASSVEARERGWMNSEYCKLWGGTPTPGDYQRWRALRAPIKDVNLDDPFTSYEHFAGLSRVRPGIKDSEAAKRRVGYRGKDRHAADMEGEGDACNKAFSIKCGLTQGVFNVVCPHVITLGFRCLFRAESVGEALSIILERFPKLPKVVFYDVACKLDKNALRRVRPILRAHKVQFILDRPHSITHSCSPVYMPDESLGATAGVATQAAEVSHSIAVVNRTSLAYMAPATYMVHKMTQVALMNVRKLHRLSQANANAENDHISLARFYHQRLSRVCQRGVTCSCSTTSTYGGREQLEWESTSNIVGVIAGDGSPQVESVRGVGRPADGDEQSLRCRTVAPDHADSGATALPGKLEGKAGCGPTGVVVEGLTPQPGHGVVLQLRAASTHLGDVDPVGQGGSPSTSGDVATDALGDGLADAGETGLARRRHAAANSDDVPTGGLRRRSSGRVEEEPRALGTGASGAQFAPLSVTPLPAHCATFVESLGLDDSPTVPVRPQNHARIVLMMRDFYVLFNERWLTDNVLNSFAALVNHRDGLARAQRRDSAHVLGAPLASCAQLASGAPSAVPRAFMFSTFFYSRLSAKPGIYDYPGVRNWTAKKNVSIHDVDLLLVPVLVGSCHWVLATINLRDRYFLYYDPYLVSDDGGIISTLRRWLKDEAQDKLGGASAGLWDVENWPSASSAHLPLQTDSSSCGVFVLVAADCLALGLPATFTQRDVPVLRRRIAMALYLDDLTVNADVRPTDGPFIAGTSALRGTED